MDTYLPCIYMGNPEVLVGKLMFDSSHSVWGASENMGRDFLCVFFFFCNFSTQLIWMYIVAGRPPNHVKFYSF